jgi:hypothetical protein
MGMSVDWNNFTIDKLNNPTPWFRELYLALKERVNHALVPYDVYRRVAGEGLPVADYLYRMSGNWFNYFDYILSKVLEVSDRSKNQLSKIPGFIRHSDCKYIDGETIPKDYPYYQTRSFATIYGWEEVLIDAGYPGGLNDKIEAPIFSPLSNYSGTQQIYDWVIQRKKILELLTWTLYVPNPTFVYYKTLKIYGDHETMFNNWQTQFQAMEWRTTQNPSWDEYNISESYRLSAYSTYIIGTASRAKFFTKSSEINRADFFYAVTRNTQGYIPEPIGQIDDIAGDDDDYYTIINALTNEDRTGQMEYETEIYPEQYFYNLHNPFDIAIYATYINGESIITRIQKFDVPGGFEFFLEP